MAEVAEHHGKQEGEGDDGVGGCRQEGKFSSSEQNMAKNPRVSESARLTWAHLAIVPHPVRLHDALKSTCELVGSQQRGGSVGAGDAVHKGGDGGVSFPLPNNGTFKRSA